MKKITRASTWALVALLLCGIAVGDDHQAGHRFAGSSDQNDWDPGLPRRVAHFNSPQQLIAGVYQGTRAERMAAIAAMGVLSDPWPVLPYLASLLTSRERQVAGLAAESLWRSLQRVQDRLPGQSPSVAGQREQLASLLFEAALDKRLDSDLRAVAVGAAHRLDSAAHAYAAELDDLLADSDLMVRRAALALVEVPIPDDILGAVGSVGLQEPDHRLRGQAAALLCENALAHGVTEPSADLKQLIRGVLTNEFPAESVAAVLSCLKNFSVSARIDLVDQALGHEDPAVAAFWDQLQG